MERICGLLIVRLGHLCFDEQARAGFLKKPLHIDDVYYGGIERMPWFDLDEFFFEAKLPEPLARFRRQLKASSNDFSGIDVCPEVSEIGAVMRFLESVGNQQNEVVAVRSPLLGEIKGESEVDLDIIWRGFDVVSLGHWSLLANGLFVKPDLFHEFTNHLNSHGLFLDASLVDSYVQTYEELSEAGEVEPLPPQVCGIDYVEVGAVTMEAGST